MNGYERQVDVLINTLEGEIANLQREIADRKALISRIRPQAKKRKWCGPIATRFLEYVRAHPGQRAEVILHELGIEGSGRDLMEKIRKELNGSLVKEGPTRAARYYASRP